MKRYRIRFELKADMQVGVEGKTFDEAIDKIMGMTLAELAEEGWTYNYDVDDFECEAVESETAEYEVLIKDIEWDTEDATRLPVDLPKEDKAKIVVDSVAGEILDADVEEAAADYLLDVYGAQPLDLKVEVISKKD